MIAKILLVVGMCLVMASIALAVIQARNNSEAAQIWRSLSTASPAAERFHPETIAHLPEPVRRYLLHAIALDTPLASSVQLTMRGSFRLAPDRDWMPMQAEEILSTTGLAWKATVGQGLIQMRGVDYYSNGKGRTRFSLWGAIPVVNASNLDIDRSARGRWIGELFWLPAALLPQRGAIWQVLDENTIQASLKTDGEPMTLTLAIDLQGKLLKVSLLRWGNQSEDGSYTEIPFGGTVAAEQTFEGYTIPSQMGAGWWMGTDRYFEFIQIAIEQAKFQ